MASLAATRTISPCADVPAPVCAFTHVEVHRDAAAVREAWAELETSAPCSIYQTRAFLLSWIETLANGAGLAPVFVLARGADARPAALFCLGLRRHGPVRIACWLGGRDANFNLPLVARGGAWSAREIIRLLRAAHGALGGEAPDLFAFTNQPFAWQGVQNPMVLLPHQVSPSAAYATALPRDAELLLAARFSKDARKKLRKKQARLAAQGEVIYAHAASPAARERVVDAFLALRNAHFRAQGIASPFEAPAMREFILAASDTSPPGLELHSLEVGSRIVAVYGGAAHQGQWSGMFNAFDTDPTVATTSPGELLLQRVVAAACGRGLERFDLGVGAARYKAALCDEEIALFDVFVPVTALGRLIAFGLAARHALKRIVKANPRLLALARRVRAAGRRG